MAIIFPPPVTFKGTASPHLAELVTQVSAKMLKALQGPDPSDRWRMFCGVNPTEPGEETVKFILDPEDLGVFEPDVGPIKLPEGELTSFTIPQAPWRKTKGIPRPVIQRGTFGSYPDKTSAMMLAGRRTVPRIVASVLNLGTTVAKTYQGIPLFVDENSGTKHRNNPGDDTKGDFFNLYADVNFDTPGWDQAQDDMAGQLGLDGYHTLGLEVTLVLGGTKMRKHFNKVFKRMLILESDTNGAAAVSNVHWEALEEGVGAVIMPDLDVDADYQAGKQVWHTISTTLPVARPIEVLLENDGVPSLEILGEDSEFATINNKVAIIGRMAANAGAAWAQTVRRYVGEASSL